MCDGTCDCGVAKSEKEGTWWNREQPSERARRLTAEWRRSNSKEAKAKVAAPPKKEKG